MTGQPYEYWGKMAELWDFFRGDTSRWADRFFYLELVEREARGPVLDVGCGTGRILLDYMQQGIDIDGVDNSPEMLALCKRKGEALGLQPRLYAQHVEALALPRRYGVILIPSSSIQLVTDPQAARTAMQRLHDHLLPDGVIAASIMDFFAFNGVAGQPLDSGWSLGAERQREEDGLLFRRWSRTIYDPATECESTEDRYEVVVDGAVVESETHIHAPATRNYTQEQARRLFAEAGFTDIRLFHEFTWEPARPEDTLFTVVARKQA